jgi:hypothetical protein
MVWSSAVFFLHLSPFPIYISCFVPVNFQGGNSYDKMEIKIYLFNITLKSASTQHGGYSFYLGPVIIQHC